MNIYEVIGMALTVAGIVYTAGRWTARRESSSKEIRDVRRNLHELNNWRNTLNAELDKVYVRKETVAIELRNIDSRIAEINSSLSVIKQSQLEVAINLAKLTVTEKN